MCWVKLIDHQQFFNQFYFYLNNFPIFYLLFQIRQEEFQQRLRVRRSIRQRQLEEVPRANKTVQEETNVIQQARVPPGEKEQHVSTGQATWQEREPLRRDEPQRPTAVRRQFRRGQHLSKFDGKFARGAHHSRT